jgi:hypothetical protein
MVSWLHCFWACGEPEHHSGRAWWNRAVHLHGGTELFIFWRPGNKEKERERDREKERERDKERERERERERETQDNI